MENIDVKVGNEKEVSKPRLREVALKAVSNFCEGAADDARTLAGMSIRGLLYELVLLVPVMLGAAMVDMSEPLGKITMAKLFVDHLAKAYLGFMGLTAATSIGAGLSSLIFEGIAEHTWPNKSNPDG